MSYQIEYADAAIEHLKFFAIAAFESKPVALLVAIADLERVSLSSNPQFLEIIDRSKQQQKAGKVVSK